MQTVVAVPDFNTLTYHGEPDQVLLRKVCGVPLLLRTILTAKRAGSSSILVLWPKTLPIELWKQCQAGLRAQGLRLILRLQAEPFRPHRPLHWEDVAPMLEDRFLWLPWDFVTHKRAVAALDPCAPVPVDWDVPAIIEKAAVRGETALLQGPQQRIEGMTVLSEIAVRPAEQMLVMRSGKPLDGIYSTFNRKLCRPVVRCLSHTPITPNMVSVAGLLVAVAACGWFAQGHYAAYVGGALAFFLSGLFDEMDGMLARIKFRESAFGTWFEGFVDNATYLLVFGGMTAGLYRQYGQKELLIGCSLIVGAILSVIVVNLQRRVSTDPARPNEYLGNVYKLLDQDSANWISRMVRHIHVFLKKAVAIHYLLLFSVIGALPVFLRLAAFGANLTWILGIYFSRRFFRVASAQAGPAVSSL